MLKWLPLACVLACGGKPVAEETSDTGKTSTTPTGSTTVVGFEGLTVEVDTCREATVRARWTGEAATSYLRYGEGETLDQVTPSVVGEAEVEIVIRGLINGSTVKVQPVTELSDGTRMEAPAQDVALGLHRRIFSHSQSIRTSPIRNGPRYGGHLLLSTLGSGAVTRRSWMPPMVNTRWWLTVDDPDNEAVGRAHLSADGQTIFWNDYDRARIDDIANVYGSNLDGCDTTTTRTLWGHHDFVELADGKTGWLGFTYDEATKVPGYGSIPVVADNIYEAPLGSAKGEEVGMECSDGLGLSGVLDRRCHGIGGLCSKLP